MTLHIRTWTPRPLPVEAVQYDGTNTADLLQWMRAHGQKCHTHANSKQINGEWVDIERLVIETRDRSMKVIPGDYIVREPNPTHDHKFTPIPAHLFEHGHIEQPAES